jgi:hypothetical protein
MLVCDVDDGGSRKKDWNEEFLQVMEGKELHLR